MPLLKDLNSEADAQANLAISLLGEALKTQSVMTHLKVAFMQRARQFMSDRVTAADGQVEEESEK